MTSKGAPAAKIDIKDSIENNSEDSMESLNDMQPQQQEGVWSWDPRDWYSGVTGELLRAMFGEGLVTFLFMFIVMATSVNNGRQTNPESLVLSCISTAFAAVALIYSFADVSGAHFNPAVTFATMITGKVSVKKALSFIGVQLMASVFATIFLMVVFPATPGVSIPASVVVHPRPDANLVNAFFMEVTLTFILVYVIFATAFDTVDTKGVKVDGQTKKLAGANLTIYTTSGNSKAGFAPIAIGFTLGFLCFIGGTVSGGAFNPARAFGPALVSGEGWGTHWIYWVGDFLGAAMAGYCQSFFAHEATQNSNSVKARKN